MTPTAAQCDHFEICLLSRANIDHDGDTVRGTSSDGMSYAGTVVRGGIGRFCLFVWVRFCRLLDHAHQTC